MPLRSEIRAFIEARTAQANQRDFYRKPLTAFSSAADPLYATFKDLLGPHHLLPRDMLPDVITLVSFFLPFSRRVIEANRKEPVAPAREWVDAYLHANALLDAISRELVAMLRAQGINAGVAHAADHYDETLLRSCWSHRSAAFVAGLGRFGLNRMLISPVGGAGRYGTVLLSEALPPSLRPEEELCFFFKSKSCCYCLKHCPVKALGSGPDEFDRQACNRKLLNVSPYSRSQNLRLDVCGKCDVGPCAIL